MQRLIVLVDRNPIRKVLELQPVSALPSISFRFKLEQASPVRALALTADGLWHVGGALVDSAGGWLHSARWLTRGWQLDPDPGPDQRADVQLGRTRCRAACDAAARLRVRVRVRIMHPMDTGLVGGIPAFYVSRLAVRDGLDRELLRIQTFEPVSENPVFSFEFATPPNGPLRITGLDNNGNRIDSRID